MAPPAPAPHADPIDWHELDRAWHLLRSAAERFDGIAAEEGWPTPFMSTSTMAYHLDALEGAGLVRRVPWTLYDRRKVAVRLTDAGEFAVRRLDARRYAPAISSPAMARP